MLELQAITKDYRSGTECVHALRGVSLRFRDNEFVSILGPSGCGKSRKTPCRRNSAKTLIRQSCNGCFARKIPCKKANCCQTNWYAESKTCCQKTDSKYNRKTPRFQATCKASSQNDDCKPAGKETRSANPSTARPQRTGHL